MQKQHQKQRRGGRDQGFHEGRHSWGTERRRDEAGGLGGKQAMSCKASDFIVGTLGSHGMFKQERMVLQEAPLVHSGKWAWGPAWKQRVARPLLLAGENGTGEKWVDFGGSFFPSWCLDSGAWGRVMSDFECPELVWVQCSDFLGDGEQEL